MLTLLIQAMKNAYLSYCKMFLLYLKIFKMLGVKALPFKAETGPIGGSLSHEFILETSNGESEIFYDNRIYDINFQDIDPDNSCKIKKLYLTIVNITAVQRKNMMKSYLIKVFLKKIEKFLKV